MTANLLIKNQPSPYSVEVQRFYGTNPTPDRIACLMPGEETSVSIWDGCTLTIREMKDTPVDTREPSEPKAVTGYNQEPA